MNWLKTIVCSLLVTFCACNNQVVRKPMAGEDGLSPVLLKYARGFRLAKKKNGESLLTMNGIGADSTLTTTFRLVPRLMEKIPEGDGVIPVPCKRIICLSSTQLTYFFALEDIDEIVAINSSRHLFHHGMNARIASGAVKQVGKEGHFNTELIAGLHPDVIFVSPFKAGGYDVLKSLGFPLVPMGAYAEETPLARAEWIKMIAAFTDREQQADSLFSTIEQRYNGLKALTLVVEKRPSVFSGKMKSGNWYVPGGDSFYARLFRDAGADYVFNDDRKAAYPLDFESVYAHAAQADYWRILIPEAVGFDRRALEAEDSRYADFKAFRTGSIIECNIREKPYYEQSAMKPDVILADYIHFFHPELLPDYQTEFYSRMK